MLLLFSGRSHWCWLSPSLTVERVKVSKVLLSVICLTPCNSRLTKNNRCFLEFLLRNIMTGCGDRLWGRVMGTGYADGVWGQFSAGQFSCHRFPLQNRKISCDVLYYLQFWDIKHSFLAFFDLDWKLFVMSISKFGDEE